MKRLIIALPLLGTICFLNAQNSQKAIQDLNSQEQKTGTPGFMQKSLYPNYYESSPDSIVMYSDSLQNIPALKIINVYSDNLIESTKAYLDSDQWIKESKIEYYLDNELPDLLYDPILGGSSGSSNGYDYTYESSIGDSLSMSYSWDSDQDSWIFNSKTQHYISENGIDTLAISYAWDALSSDWVLNNTVNQAYSSSVIDSLYFTMVTNDKQDTLQHYLYVLKYNDNQQLEFSQQIDDGYISVDSLIYNDDNLLKYDFMGSDGEYTYMYDYRYDENNRKTAIFFWDKQSGQEVWEFDGCVYFYYPEEISSSIQYTEINKEYTIYPNPASDKIKITDYEGVVTIRNIAGQTILEQSVKNNQSVNINQLSKGIYILSLQNGYSTRLIKK